jgi:hypothetical protein
MSQTDHSKQDKGENEQDIEDDQERDHTALKDLHE